MRLAPLYSGFTALIAVLLLSACDQGPIRISPVTDVGDIKPGRLAAAKVLIDGGFETGLASWHTCSNYAPTVSTESASGQQAVSLPSQSCIYQTVKTKSESAYQLSCQTRKTGDGWAALTLAYLDEKYRTLHSEEIPVWSDSYSQSNVSLNAVEGATFVEVLAYTNGAELHLDDCVLESTDTQPGVISNSVADGLFPTLAEVKDQQAFSFDEQDVAKNDIDWREAWIAHNDQGYYVAWDTYYPVESYSWGLGVYIDTDRNRDTGFVGFNSEFPIGVDYLVEGVEQFHYTGSGTDWSWELVKTGGSALQFIAKDDVNAKKIDLFFLANSASVGGKSIDYYPDSVADTTASSTLRYFTYEASGEIIPPVDPVDPINPPPVTPLAALDVRLNLEGAESWLVTNASNFPNEIHLKNIGNVTLTDIAITGSLGNGCAYNYPSLQPGEVKVEVCNAPVGNSHYQHAIAVGFAPDGQEVRDDDSTSISTIANNSRNLLSIRPEKVVTTIGESLTFDIQVASSGLTLDDRITSVTSSIDACSKVFAEPVPLDTIAVYQCTVTADQLPLAAGFETVSINAANSAVPQTVNIVEAGVATLSARTTPATVATDLFRRGFRVQNFGALEVSNIEISGRSMDCTPSIIGTPVTTIPVGGQSHLFNCSGIVEGRGEMADAALVVTGTLPDGSPFETVIEIDILNSRDVRLRMNLANSDSNVIEGAPGEVVTVAFELQNQGYFAAENINIKPFDSTLQHPEYARALRYNPNAPVPPQLNSDNCVAAANAITSQPNFSLAAGDSIQFECTVVMPDSNVYVTPYGSHESAQQPFAGMLGYFRMVSVDPIDNSLPQVSAYIPAPDQALSNPAITAARVTQLLENSDFENVDTDGLPSRWVSGCTPGATSKTGYYGNALGVPSTGCASYVLNANEMAQLAGNKFSLGCEITSQYRGTLTQQNFASLTISLDGIESIASMEYAQGYLHIDATAPFNLSGGYISLYTSNGSSEFDNCQLILKGAADNTASVAVTNHFDGPDVYKRSNPMDFLVTVTNDGDVDLQNIEVSSSVLPCSRNYASLTVGESKEFMCESNGELLSHWDQRVSHVMTASADSSQSIVADIDFSAYGNLYPISRDLFTVSVNGLPQNEITPVAIGSDVELQIDLVQTTHESIAQMASTIPACRRQIAPSMEPGDYIRYTCAIENIQEDTAIHFTPLIVGESYTEGGVGVLTNGNGAFTIEVAP